MSESTQEPTTSSADHDKAWRVTLHRRSGREWTTVGYGATERAAEENARQYIARYGPLALIDAHDFLPGAFVEPLPEGDPARVRLGEFYAG